MSVFIRDSVGLQAVLGVRGDRKTTAHNSVPGQCSCPTKYEPQVGNRGCVGFFFFSLRSHSSVLVTSVKGVE